MKLSPDSVLQLAIQVVTLDMKLSPDSVLQLAIQVVTL